MTKKLSPQKAIANHCKGCIYDPLAGGTYREQIEACTITSCELYDHRPRSKAYRDKVKAEYMASLSPEELEIELARKAKQSEKAKQLFANR